MNLQSVKTNAVPALAETNAKSATGTPQAAATPDSEHAAFFARN